MKKKRRKSTEEFKTEAVKLILEQGYSISEAARNLGIHANLLGRFLVTAGYNKVRFWVCFICTDYGDASLETSQLSPAVANIAHLYFCFFYSLGKVCIRK